MPAAEEHSGAFQVASRCWPEQAEPIRGPASDDEDETEPVCSDHVN